MSGDDGDALKQRLGAEYDQMSAFFEEAPRYPQDGNAGREPSYPGPPQMDDHHANMSVPPLPQMPRQPTMAGGLQLGAMGLMEDAGPPIVDRDVERLSEQLDNMSNMLKREVMGSFLDTKNLLLGKQTEILDAERRQNSALLAKKQDEIEMYKEKLASALGECERQLIIIEQMGEFLAQKGAQKDGGMEMGRAFSYWKEELVAARHAKMIQRWPEPHFVKKLLRKYMSGWRWASRVGRREAVDKFWTDKMETMSTSIVAEYENRLAEMQHELSQAYSALEAERAQRNQLYEDLMNQFRRGVCAFNLEALGNSRTEPSECSLHCHKKHPLCPLYAMQSCASL